MIHCSHVDLTYEKILNKRKYHTEGGLNVGALSEKSHGAMTSMLSHLSGTASALARYLSAF